jgi:Lecithin retinol acyltransferase
VDIAQSHISTTRRVGLRREPFRLERGGYDRISRPPARGLAGLCRADRLLAGNEEPALGAHLVTPRLGYVHHGVYVGGGTVVHYGGFVYHWRRGPVEEISLTRFAQGHPIWVRPSGPNSRQCEEIVRRARSRLGENHYRLFSNNCEHFSEWCVNGEHRSPQVDRLLARLQCVSRALSQLMRYLEVAPLRHSDSRS